MKKIIALSVLVFFSVVLWAQSVESSQLEHQHDRYYRKKARMKSPWRWQMLAGVNILNDNVSTFKPAPALQINGFYRVNKRLMVGGQFNAMYAVSMEHYERQGTVLSVNPRLAIQIIHQPDDRLVARKVQPGIEVFAGYAFFPYQQALVNTNADGHFFQKTFGSPNFGMAFAVKVREFPAMHMGLLLKAGMEVYTASSIFGFEDKFNPLIDKQFRGMPLINDNSSASNNIFILVGLEF